MQKLDFYKRSDGFNTWYESEDGCHFDTLEDLLQCQVVGHCGCGVPEKNLKLIYDMLKLNQKHHDEKPISFDGQEFNDYCQRQSEEIKNYICKNWDKFIYFFFYVMNDKRIMEHGGSIPGWICDHNFMEAIEEWHKEYIIEHPNDK